MSWRLFWIILALAAMAAFLYFSIHSFFSGKNALGSILLTGSVASIVIYCRLWDD